MASPSSLVSDTGTWHSSPTSNQAPLLCFRPPSTPCLCPVRVQLVHSPGSTSLWSFISDRVCFKSPHLKTSAWTCTNSLAESLAEQWLGAGLPPENIHVIAQQQRFRDYGKSQCIASARFHHTLTCLSQYQETWLLSRVHWDLCL